MTELTWLLRTLLVKCTVAANWKTITTLSVQDPDWVQKFDSEFLNKDPVIVEGISICPTKLTSVETILDVCHPKMPTEVHYSRKGNADDKSFDSSTGLYDPEMMGLGQYVNSLLQANLSRPSYVFSMPMEEVCPSAFESMTMPSHLMSHFQGEFCCKFRQCSVDKLVNGLYINSGFFATTLHNDEGHRPGYSSMCQGQKTWRIVSNHDFLDQRKEFDKHIKSQGVPAKLKSGGKALLEGYLKPQFETWSKDSPLEAMNVTIYEGTIGPNQVLYVPAGALHAAKALTSTSIMVSTNDYSFEDLEFVHTACGNRNSPTRVRDAPPGIRPLCKSYWARTCGKYDFITQWKKNKKENSAAPREAMPFLEFRGCSNKENLCKVAGKHNQAWEEYCGITKNEAEL